MPAIIVLCVSTFLGIILSSIVNSVIDFYFYAVWAGSLFSLFCVFILNAYKVKKLQLRSVTQAYQGAIAFLLTFSFLSSVPLTIDRSLSVWMLSNINNTQIANMKITAPILQENSKAFFFGSDLEIQRRVAEQKRLGNVQVDTDGTIELSAKGKFQVLFNKLVGKLFFLNQRYPDGI